MDTSDFNSSEKLRFVDPTVDPSILFDAVDYMFETDKRYLTVRLLSELFRRFPSIEYAVGFDGVDDYIFLEDLDISDQGLDLRARVWASRSSRSYSLLGLTDSNGERILELAKEQGESSEIQSFYRNSGDIQQKALSQFAFERWLNLRVWSDGSTFSIEIDGDLVTLMPDIELGDGPFKLYFGSGNGHRFFEGMVKNIQIQQGSEDLFKLESGDSPDIRESHDSMGVVGVHHLKKGRFQKNFTTEV